MLLLAGWVAVFSAGLAWRLPGPGLALPILFLGVAALPATAAFWGERARRQRFSPPAAPFVDLEQRRISEVDAYVSEQLATGAGVSDIAASAAWFDRERSTRATPG